MEISEEELAERYDLMTTSALLKLKMSGGLTPAAALILDAVMEKRDVPTVHDAAEINPYERPKSRVNKPTDATSVQRLFRVLVVVQSLIYAFGFLLLPYLESVFSSSGVADALSWNGYGSLIPYDYLLVYLLFLVWIITMIALYYFKPWARSALLWLILFSTVSGPFWGVAALSALSATIAFLLSTLSGGILAISYLTSVSSCFKKS